jgi:predicted O-methyltransferase YrrM
MIDTANLRLPSILQGITATTEALELTMTADLQLGALLRTLAASKPGGRFLELGTGTGIATTWLLDGMDAEAQLLTVERDPSLTAVAARFMGHDPRLTIHNGDAAELLAALHEVQARFDLIFADLWPGKATLLEATLALLAPGGLYVTRDLLPQDDGSEAQRQAVADFIAALEARPDLQLCKLAWSSGVIVAAKG